MADALLEAFFSNAKEERRERKNDELIDFVRTHPALFHSSARQMSLLCEELRQRGELTLPALCEALGLSDMLLFRRAKLVEAAGLMMNPLKSPLYKKFLKAVQDRRAESGKDYDPELVVVVVAGARSLVITNLIPRRVPGLVHLSVPAEEGHEDVHIFPVADAAARLPRIFKQEE